MDTALNMIAPAPDASTVAGDFADLDGERFYRIRNADKMAPFLVSVISSADHWLFVSSTGGLTAGRVSPETALFPYLPVDKVHESSPHTGPRTLLRIHASGQVHPWEPFNRERDQNASCCRNLYKSLLGDKLCFEETHHDLQVTFRYTWLTSDPFGFVRRCELFNFGEKNLKVELLDGLLNLLPAGTPRFMQTNASNLVDAYKWSEVDCETGLALFSLYSGISDRAEPCESLRANVAYCLGLDAPTILLSDRQLDDFRQGAPPRAESLRRGTRGAFLVNATFDLPPNTTREWQIVANIEQSQREVVELRRQLQDPAQLADRIRCSTDRGTDALARYIAKSDGLQTVADEVVSAHHCANVLFNILRGGTFYDHGTVPASDFRKSIRHFNREVYRRNQDMLSGLPEAVPFGTLLDAVTKNGDPQLIRLCREYLPITFGRRHGDPSRPWNEFAIHVQDESKNPVLSYEGNWRDIFQNWEALTFSCPEFVESAIAKFVNASTPDGYNPYRITKDGIDWEVDDPDDPWSYIGYWGDHQIIYLLKLLELSSRFHPDRLRHLLREPIFCYANVPYRIKSIDALLANPKSTVDYDEALAEVIEGRVENMGADGKLILDSAGDVYQVNLVEKLLVPLLSKLGNLVIDGGIWMNTQRPEWNDANNALVGQGLSMVTLYYTRRYLRFLQSLLANESGSFAISREVGQWLCDTAAALRSVRQRLCDTPVSADLRHASLVELGTAASRYREAIYAQQTFTGTVEQPVDQVMPMLEDALAAVDHSIATNLRADGLYHSYNTLNREPGALRIDRLYPMLEGQVAVLSSGVLDAQAAAEVVDALFSSDIYRPDQQSFMLYPDRELPRFLEKNRIPAEEIEAIPLLGRMLNRGDERIVLRDADGCFRFNASFTNVGDLARALDALVADHGAEVAAARPALETLFEKVFQHKSFTGRSGTMFAFEGLGSIYWHMVGKLLLAVQENYFAATDGGADDAVRQRLGRLYYRVREGLGFNKTPAEYGAFPTDPYSHTPQHGGASQPGMTGQVKEEVLTRFGELGLRVERGVVRFQPDLLRSCEFPLQARQLRFLDVDGEWRDLQVPANTLAFTWCQVPVVYRLEDKVPPALVLHLEGGETRTSPTLELSREDSADVFQRRGAIRQITVNFSSKMLFAG